MWRFCGAQAGNNDSFPISVNVMSKHLLGYTSPNANGLQKLTLK
jgi:hypothetical protein